MELTKRQINRYIRLFTEDEYINALERVKERKTLWFVEEQLQSSDYPYHIFTDDKWVDDELDFVGYYEIVGIKTKEEARELAKDYQRWASEQCLSYGELAYYTELFTKLGKRFGLIREFKENAIL